MRISDLSSDVCSSDLAAEPDHLASCGGRAVAVQRDFPQVFRRVFDVFHVGRKQVVDAGAVAAVRADFLTRQAERNNKRFRGENGIVDDFLRLNVEFIIAGDPLTVELVDHKRKADFGTVESLEAPTAQKFGGADRKSVWRGTRVSVRGELGV